MTFTLPGFTTVKREGIELTGSFTATVNAELRVGALEETITVTGEAPIVDVQSTTRQRVLEHGDHRRAADGTQPVQPGRADSGHGGQRAARTSAASAGFDAAIVLTIHGSKTTTSG